LGYFKQGDDMASCICQTKTYEKAFRFHASMLREIAEHLDAVADVIKGEKVEVFADTHYISIKCSDALAKKLIAKKLGIIDEE